jgi:hypothetical protein
MYTSIIEFSGFLPLEGDREIRWWEKFISKIQDNAPIANFELGMKSKNFGVWIHATAGEAANIQKVAYTVHRFFLETNCRRSFAITCSCSSPRNEIDQFTGLAVFVTAQYIKSFNCRDWLKKQIEEFEKQNKECITAS